MFLHCNHCKIEHAVEQTVVMSDLGHNDHVTVIVKPDGEAPKTVANVITFEM